MRIKIAAKNLRNKKTKELLEMKKELETALLHTKMWSNERSKGLSPKEVKRNIARINTILKERGEVTLKITGKERKGMSAIGMDINKYVKRPSKRNSKKENKKYPYKRKYGKRSENDT